MRTHGKGRVFYTAYGHDGRTWGNPAFHDLVERGIRWAANKGEVFDSPPQAQVGPRAVHVRRARIDRSRMYLPGKRWGTQGRDDPADAASAFAGGVDEAHGPAPRLRGETVRLRARDRQADHDGVGPQGPALGLRDGRLPQQPPAQGRRSRPDQDLRRHRRRRQGRQVHGLRRQAQYPDQSSPSRTAA